jgi:hypothetical protein
LALYKVVFLGLAVAGPEEAERLINGLQKRFALSPEKAENLLQRVPIVVRKGMVKEEMEKYLRAFEEIGGRARIEEEPAESLEIFPEPPLEPRRENERLGSTFESSIRDMPVEEKDSPAWESNEGFINAFFKTLRGALFSPKRFFKKVASGTGYWISLVYGLICGAIADYTNMFWIWLFFSIFFQYLPQKFSFVISFFSGAVIILLLIILPILETLTILIGSATTHLCLIIVGGNKKGFEATFRTFSYANSARLFYVIPFFVIPFLAPLFFFALTLYHLILIIIGIRECNGISTGKATLAVMLPLLIIIGLSVLLTVLLPLLLGMIGLHSRVSV